MVTLRKLGTALTSIDRNSEAKLMYSRALKLNDKNSDTHYAYALFMEKIHRYDEAEKHYLAALQLDPCNIPCLCTYAGNLSSSFPFPLLLFFFFLFIFTFLFFLCLFFWCFCFIFFWVVSANVFVSFSRCSFLTCLPFKQTDFVFTFRQHELDAERLYGVALKLTRGEDSYVLNNYGCYRNYAYSDTHGALLLFYRSLLADRNREYSQAQHASTSTNTTLAESPQKEEDTGPYRRVTVPELKRLLKADKSCFTAHLHNFINCAKKLEGHFEEEESQEREREKEKEKEKDQESGKEEGRGEGRMERLTNSENERVREHAQELASKVLKDGKVVRSLLAGIESNASESSLKMYRPLVFITKSRGKFVEVSKILNKSGKKWEMRMEKVNNYNQKRKLKK